MVLATLLIEQHRLFDQEGLGLDDEEQVAVLRARDLGDEPQDQIAGLTERLIVVVADLELFRQLAATKQEADLRR